MPKHLARSLMVALAAMVALVSPTLGASAAQAAAPADQLADQISLDSPPGVTCPVRTVCTWSEADFVGTPFSFATVDFHSRWYSFNALAGFNPDSLANASGSAVYLGNHVTRHWTCVPALTAAPGLNDHRYGYFFVTYGVGACDSVLPAPIP